MPKAILEFQLPQDNEEFQLAINAGKLHSVLWELSQHFRLKYKYEGPPSDATFKEFEELRTKFWEFMNEKDVEL